MQELTKRFALFVVALCMSACASVTSTVKPDSTPSPDSGYIVGLFAKNKSSGVGLGIVSLMNGAEYLLPFGEDTSLPAAKDGEFSMIKVPPGQYQIKNWVTYATLTKEIFKKSDINDLALTVPFRVERGAVLFVGSYSVVQQQFPLGNGIRLVWNLRRSPISQEEARDSFMKAYPGYSKTEFSCWSCSN